MKHKMIFIIVVLLALTSCRSDIPELTLAGDPSQITFGVTITEGYSQSQVKTRGTPQVGITAYENAKITVQGIDLISDAEEKNNFIVTLSKSGGKWITNPAKSYDGLTYDFYAYASDLDKITTSANENGLSVSLPTTENPIPTISYVVPADVTKQPDLLIGDKVGNKKSGQVSLSMYHALSCIGFVASSKHIDNVRKVKSVTVKNVYGAGATQLNKSADTPITWTVDGNPDVTFEAGMKGDEKLDDRFDDIVNKLTYLMQGNGYLMMVPQTLPEGVQVVMEIWDGLSISSIHTITYDIPPTTWEPGKKYVYYFDEPILDGVATYYEHYTNGTSGLYYYDGKQEKSTLVDDVPIADAGYGLLVPASTYTQYPSIYLGLGTGGDEPKDKSTSNGSVVAQLSTFTASLVDCVLYPLSQNLYPYNRITNVRKGFSPYRTDIPVRIEAGVSVTGTGKPINTRGYFLPHYAKGVYQTADKPSDYYIRTPIQMRNISYQTAVDGPGLTVGKNYVQDVAVLDFTVHSDRTIYGKDITHTSFYRESIIIGGFGGTFDGSQSPGGKATIAGLIISTPDNHPYNTALFEWVTTGGILKKIETAASCVYIAAQTTAESCLAGIAAVNSGIMEDIVNRASITNRSTSNMKVAGVAGQNSRLMQRCKNYGVINNESSDYYSRTGGIVAINEKYYAAWSGLDGDDKATFRSLQKNDFFASMIDKYPGAVISNCENHARIVGSGRTGGITAYNNYGGVVYQCTNTGEIRNNGKCEQWIMLGGIVGLQQCGEKNNNPADPPQFFSTIQECVNKGRVTAVSGVFGNTNLTVGGIVGNNDFAEGEGTYEIAAYGKVNRCVVDGTTISGYFSDTGGIAGLNSGNVNRSLCTQVYIGGTFGQGTDIKKRNSAGGIVGTNNNYVGSCLFVHSSPTTPISEAPVWFGSSSSGGIVGINNTNSSSLKSSSGYVQKCVFSAQAPKNIPTGSEVGTFAPIAGYSGGYLYRAYNGTPHIKNHPKDLDATTGATPLYTLDDNYYGSGTGVNFTNLNISLPNEPIVEEHKVGPFTAGRYPYGQTRFQQGGKDLIPVAGWFILNDIATWKSKVRPPIPNGLPVGYESYSYKLPSGDGTLYIQEALVREIKNRCESGISGVVSFNPIGLKIASTVRISLNYLSDEELANVTSIECDLGDVTFLPNNAGGEGSLFFRAPHGWKFDSSQVSPKPYKMIVLDNKGNETLRYWYCLVTSTTGKKIQMVRNSI